MALVKRQKPWKEKLTPGKQYPVDEALKLVKEFATAKFAESVDAAVNLGIDEAHPTESPGERHTALRRLGALVASSEAAFGVRFDPVGERIWLVDDTGARIDEDRALLAHLDQSDWTENPELAAQLRGVLEPLAAHYFLKARTPKGRLIDSVARFHLGNGARLERIDWLGDLSPKGLRESAGFMVNYLYRLDDIEKNHEAYANSGEVIASSAVKKLLRNEGRRLLDMRLG